MDGVGVGVGGDSDRSWIKGVIAITKVAIPPSTLPNVVQNLILLLLIVVTE